MDVDMDAASETGSLHSGGSAGDEPPSKEPSLEPDVPLTEEQIHELTRAKEHLKDVLSRLRKDVRELNGVIEDIERDGLESEGEGYIKESYKKELASTEQSLNIQRDIYEKIVADLGDDPSDTETDSDEE